MDIMLFYPTIGSKYNIDNLAIHWEPRHQAWVVFCLVVGVSVGGFFRLKLYSTTMNGHGKADT